MTNGSAASGGLWDELKEAYDAYRRRSFRLEPPDLGFLDRWRETRDRLSFMYLGVPLVPVLLFRLRAHLLRREVPLLPHLCGLLSTGMWGVTIGHYVEMGPGLIIPHGHVVIDGVVKIGRNCAINPWVTIGLNNSRRFGFSLQGPTIGDDVYIGTGAKVLGPITVGDGARIGANAVVLHDVPAGATVVGAPARVVQESQPDWDALKKANPS